MMTLDGRPARLSSGHGSGRRATRAMAAAAPLLDDVDVSGTPCEPAEASDMDAHGSQCDARRCGTWKPLVERSKEWLPVPRRRQRGARRRSRAILARWLSAIQTEPMEALPFYMIRDKRVRPASWDMSPPAHASYAARTAAASSCSTGCGSPQSPHAHAIYRPSLPPLMRSLS